MAWLYTKSLAYQITARGKYMLFSVPAGLELKMPRKFLLLLLQLALFLHVAVCSETPPDTYDRIVFVDHWKTAASDDSTCGSWAYPCSTLSYAMNKRLRNATQVLVVGSSTGGEYNFNRSVTVANFANISISTYSSGSGLSSCGSSQTVVTVRCVSEDVGVSFINCSLIHLCDIAFSGCAAQQNSTHRNFTDENFSFIQLPVSVYFLFCRDITLISVNITDSPGQGMAVYGAGGKNLIHSCNFLSNAPSNTSTISYGGGGLYIEYPYCSPVYRYSCNTLPNTDYNTNASFVISNSHFTDNIAVGTSASVDKSYYHFLPPDPLNRNTAGQGGALAVFLCKVTGVHISLRDSVLESNYAYFGAGLVVSLEEDAVNAVVNVSGSVFRYNHCVHENKTGGIGGGAMIQFKFSSMAIHRRNRVFMSDCEFHHNSAYMGGGAIVKASPEMAETDPTNSVLFSHCHWLKNTATVGGALVASAYNISSRKGALLKPVFQHCNFSSNTGAIAAAVVADYLPIAFCGYILFQHNGNSSLASSALIVDQTTVDIMQDTEVNFFHNIGSYGAAIGINGYGFLRVHWNTSLIFFDNYAHRAGGAIYQNPSSVGIVSNGQCFLQYFDPSVHPDNWNTSFTFWDNKANIRTGNPEPNSMLLGSLVPCIWDGYIFQRTQRQTVLNETFSDSRIIHFPLSDCTSQIRTLPNRIEQHNLSVVPGMRSQLNLTLFDDYCNNVSKYGVLNVWSSNSFMTVPSDSVYVTDGSAVLYGSRMHNGTLDVDTLPPRPLFVSIPVHFQMCPPGLTATATKNEMTCSCKRGFVSNLECDGDGNAMLRRNYWIGRWSGYDEYVVGEYPYTPSSISSFVYLPKNNSAETLNNLLCGPSNRKGVLCSQCKEGYSPSIFLRDKTCSYCGDTSVQYGWIYIVFELLAITLFFLIVVTFNISATSGSMNAFVFFAQMISGSYSLDGSGAISLSHRQKESVTAYTTLYGIWRLDFYFPHFCIGHNISNQDSLLFFYIKAIFPLILILLFVGLITLRDHGIWPFYICSKWVSKQLRRIRKPWTSQETVLHAFATFLVLSFTKFTIVSITILSPTPIYNQKGECIAWVPFYYGNQRYLSPSHIPHFIVALFFLSVFVLLPTFLLLLLPPKTKWGVRIWEKLLKIFHINSHGRFELFLKIFQGSFKDGTGSATERDYQVFAGVYFLLRFLIFISSSFMSPKDFLALQQFICTVALLVFAVFRPYRKEVYNIVDMCMFALLGVINIITLFNTFLVAIGDTISPPLFVIQHIFIYIPLVCISLRVLYKLYTHFFRGNLRTRRYFRRFNYPFHGASTEIDRDFLDFAEQADEREREARRNRNAAARGSCRLASYSVMPSVSKNGDRERNEHSLLLGSQ